MHQFHAHAQFVGLLLLAAKQDINVDKCGFQASLDITYSGEVTYCLWDNCHHDFSDPLDLFTHVMMHVDFLSSDDKVSDDEFRTPAHFKCLWENCFRHFESKGDLRKHVRHHSGEKYCACPFCGRFFSRPDKLYEHLRKRIPLPANEEDTHLCLLCQRRFGDERSLVNHVRRHINGRQCPTCGLAVPLPSDLHRHILVKHTERVKSFMCAECNKSFYCVTDLVRHTKVHEPPNEVCPTCGARFRWKKQLDKHVLTHSENTLERPYLCHICNSTYKTGHGLTRHLSRKHDCPIPEGFSSTKDVVAEISLDRIPNAVVSGKTALAFESEWTSRLAELTKLGLGGDYEWIGAVQKKFIGGGVASAIDVDAAVCIAEQKDQVDDVIDLVYKLRHSENAADLPESAEYALIRLLLRYDPSFLFKLAGDPINYGVFMNEHAACLAIDHFIEKKDFAGAARLSAWIMQQEMTENELLNLLGMQLLHLEFSIPVQSGQSCLLKNKLCPSKLLKTKMLMMMTWFALLHAQLVPGK
ncbi:zinc finger, C2H2 type [Ancylostoma caninum]|uniref:Zinc finger, C2H2 type n=1 Tax=Ancylostoma caninum TaxID=29170 RepID=A0A368FKD6_ANCCA|nr:zinc finger, C2H2 type [Ancylostoma caninum]